MKKARSWVRNSTLKRKNKKKKTKDLCEEEVLGSTKDIEERIRMS